MIATDQTKPPKTSENNAEKKTPTLRLPTAWSQVEAERSNKMESIQKKEVWENVNFLPHLPFTFSPGLG